MPFFKVELLNGSKSVLVKAESELEIVNKSIEKLDLPHEPSEYKLVLEDKITEVDSDVIEYASQSQDLMKFIIFHGKNKKELNNVYTGTSESVPSKKNSSSELQTPINLQDALWSKISPTVLAICEEGKRLSSSDRITIVQKIRDHMIDDLKDSSRRTADKIARLVCKKFPNTFCDVVEGNVWSDGIAVLRTSILNSVSYKWSLTTPRKKRSTVKDSDDEEIEARETEASLNFQVDQYGCIEYASILPLTENENTQERKRLSLLNLFTDLHRDPAEVSRLMRETFPTVRGLINNPKRDLVVISADWPFLQDANCLIEHSSTLLGKNVRKIWTNSLNNKTKTLRQYLKMHKNLAKKKEDQLKSIVDASRDAVNIRNDDIPKILIVFPLFFLYFEEDKNLFYKVIEKESTDEDVLASSSSKYPILIIQGYSFYDSNATCTIILEGQLIVYVSDVLQGLLITFICYYIFGYSYPHEIENFLEFLQRVFLQINPEKGRKKNSKKRRNSKIFNIFRSI